MERDRLLASQEFSRSPLMTILLKYLVQKQLEPGIGKLTSNQIASEALGKKSEVGNDANAYARVQVGRLRQVMNTYYAGHPHVTRLHLPNGQYRFDIISSDSAQYDTLFASSPATAQEAVAAESSDWRELRPIPPAQSIGVSALNDSPAVSDAHDPSDNVPTADYTQIYYLSATVLIVAAIILILSK